MLIVQWWDIGDPWSVVESVWEGLKGGGNIAFVCPTINQVEKLVIKLANSGFTHIETVEVLSRMIEAREGKSRPAHANGWSYCISYFC